MTSLLGYRRAVFPLSLHDDLDATDWAAEYERIRQTGSNPRYEQDLALGRCSRQTGYSSRPFSRERLLDLAKPKEPKIEWWTNVGPNVMWGTQEMLWPIPQNIKEANERVRFLAEAKKNWQPKKDRARSLFLYSCGRASAIWTVRPGIPEASVRVSDLARHKEFHEDFKEDKDEHGTEDLLGLLPKRQYLYSCGRDTPIWKVTDGAKSASERPRTNQLAEHRPPHQDFQPAKPIETIIPPNALSASASERLQALASPKRRPEGPFRPPQWPVSPAAKSVSAKPRSMELARPKGTADGYQLPRDEIWMVSRAAKKASASGRIDELSKPLVRASMDHVQFNPDAFLVKETALKGVIPRRVHDLANPIQR